MDKINKALSGVDDALCRIDGVYKSLRSLVNAKTAVRVIAASNGSFGEHAFSGAAAVVTFSGGSASLFFDGTAVAAGESPLIAVLEGSGELRLSDGQGARALIIGN